MSLWCKIINRRTAGETRSAMLYEARRANNLKEREVKALEQLAKQQQQQQEHSDDR